MHVTWPNKSNVVTLSLATSMRKKNTTAVCREPFVLLSVLPLVLPTLRHISARKTPSVTGKKNFNCPSVPSGPRLQWTFPQKTASLPVSDRVRQLPVQKNVTSSLSRMFDGSGSQSLHILTASIWRQTVWDHPENTPTSSSWRVPSRLFRSRSVGFLCELHSGSSLRRRCFTPCESPSGENWRTGAAEIMRRLLRKKGYIYI